MLFFLSKEAQFPSVSNTNPAFLALAYEVGKRVIFNLPRITFPKEQ